MNIMYIHGFGSMFNPNSPKIETLSKLGEVYGIDYDSAGNFADNLAKMLNFVAINKIDLVVGTSLGGFYASHVGALAGIPFVSINPAINPSESLLTYPENGQDHYGRDYAMDVDSVRAMPSFNMKGYGLVLLDKGDDVISAMDTINHVDGSYDVVSFEGGSHMFDHMEESLEAIQHHVDNSFVYGF